MNEHGEMNLDLDRCEKEGEAAARAPGGSVSDCPYSFSKAGVDQKTFDREWRPRLNAWRAKKWEEALNKFREGQ